MKIRNWIWPACRKLECIIGIICWMLEISRSIITSKIIFPYKRIAFSSKVEPLVRKYYPWKFLTLSIKNKDSLWKVILKKDTDFWRRFWRISNEKKFKYRLNCSLLDSEAKMICLKTGRIFAATIVLVYLIISHGDKLINYVSSFHQGERFNKSFTA